MKVILSRKGFDTSSGGGPSPIVSGRPLSLPIPEMRGRSETTYAMLGLGDLVEETTKGRISRNAFCHQDPMFEDGLCAFGQAHSSQGHLINQGVTVGDVFLFFGLFANQDGTDAHHRIFAYLRVAEIFGPEEIRNGLIATLRMFTNKHPHTLGEWPNNNCIYVGEGHSASQASSSLRLTVIGCNPSVWRLPSFFRDIGLTYHHRRQWLNAETINSTRRGQEFVADLRDCSQGRDWVEDRIVEINCC